MGNANRRVASSPLSRHGFVLALALTLALAATAAPACKPHATRGACVWTLTPPIRGIAQTCRDDATRATCVATNGEPTPTFTLGQTCPHIGFACLGDGIDAAYRHTNPDGTCPPGSSR